jgi:hypothetical protein
MKASSRPLPSIMQGLWARDTCTGYRGLRIVAVIALP